MDMAIKMPVAALRDRGCMVTLLLGLQINGLALVEPRENFSTAAVGDFCFERDSAQASPGLAVGNVDERILLAVVNQGLLRDRERVLVFLIENLGIRRHISFNLVVRVIDRDPDFKGGDVVFLHAQGSDASHLPSEGLVLERLDADAGRLAKVDSSDIRLVDLAVYVNL